MHVNKINDKKYIGVTSRDVNLRWQNGKGYKNTYFANAINKYGWENFDHVILYTNLSKEEAFETEKRLIKEYETTDRTKGYNRSIGGEAPALGMHHSEHTKEYLRKIGIENSYWKGKKLSKEMIKKIVQTKRENDSFKYGIDNPAHKSIYCIEFGATLDIASQAKKYGSSLDLSSVIKCCKGKLNSVQGLHFLYTEDVTHKNIIDKMNANTDQHHKKMVRCIETNRIFDSTVDAAKFLGVKPSSVCNACKGRIHTLKGYTWEYITNKGDYLGTNFYLLTQKKEIKEKYFIPDDYELVDNPMFGYKIHIAKTSIGWRTLWQEHSFYHSVVEFKEFYFKFENEMFLFDEYGKFYEWNEFSERVIDWAENQEKRIIHYDDYIGDIEAPIDHIEMNQRDNRNPWLKIQYWHDKDGYDFTDRPFS